MIIKGKYIFEGINGDIEITDPEVNVLFAGFYTTGEGKMVLEIEVKTNNTRFVVIKTKKGKTTDRTDRDWETKH
jgi:acyl CoA:acetate/3-ketoacid CoA transferase